MSWDDWDAATYDRIADPQTRWGAEVLDRLELAGDERVLDAGCGSGRVTELLLARVPRGSVVALDASPSMLEEARKRLGRKGRVEFVEADLGRPLPIDGPVDAVFSTATFHWIDDHEALFRNLAAVVRPGGRLVAQCGGSGNLASVWEAVRAVDPTRSTTKRFEGPDDTARRLEAAGFVEVLAWLTDAPTPFEPGEPLETFLATVTLRHHVEGLPPDERLAFARAVAANLPRPELDYVRLNILAARAPA